MKNIIIAVIFTCTAFSATQAQELLDKVPSTSSIVIKYSGDNFIKNMPLKKVDSYRFIREHFFKILHIDTISSIQHIGINFEKDVYQYMSVEDSAINFVSLVHLKNTPQFLQFIKTFYKSTAAIEKKDGFEFLPASANTYIGWKDDVAVIVNTTYHSGKNYYDEHPYSYSETTTVITEDTARLTLTETEKEEVIEQTTPQKANPKKESAKKKSTATAKTKKKPAQKKSTVKKKMPAEDEEEQIVEEQIVEAPIKDYNYNYEYDNKYRIQDSIENMKRELWYQQQDIIAKAKQHDVAAKIMTNTFANNISSIKNEISYKKTVDPSAHANVWFNNENFSNKYWSYYFFKHSYYMPSIIQKYAKDSTDGFKTGINVFFEKDRVRIEQKTFSANPKIAGLGKEIMESKQNNTFINYINTDNIGYFSMSINTEAMANYYYTLMKQYMHNTPYISEYGDLADIYIDMLEIAIDEKAIAELMPGNFLFVLHDIKPKLVTYIDYEYDKDYTEKKVTKTKKELAPDFTFLMETKREAFMEKIANLPVKYADKWKYDYKNKGGYYELAFNKEKYPISSLYFMVKDGKAIVTTSKNVIDMTLNNTAFNIDTDTKKSILNNNYSLKINSKELLEKLSPEFNTNTNKKIGNYLMENIGNVKMESRFKDDMIQGTTIMDIKGNHANSFEFFFDMIDDINNIIESDKFKNTEKVN